jgi:hypothetical protein
VETSDVPADLNLHKLLPGLRRAVEAYGQPVEETFGQRQEREAREREERPRMPRSMVGGIYVSPR